MAVRNPIQINFAFKMVKFVLEYPRDKTAQVGVDHLPAGVGITDSNIGIAGHQGADARDT